MKEFFLSYSFIRNLSEKGYPYPRNAREKWVGPRLLHYFFLEFFYSVCTILIFHSRSALAAESSVK